MDVIAKEKLGRAVGKALGIDMAMILDAPDVAVSVRLASMEAAELIRKIPTDYIGRISRAVYQSMRQQPFPEGPDRWGEEIRSDWWLRQRRGRGSSRGTKPAR